MDNSLITGLVIGGAAVTAVGAFAGYQAMDKPRSAEVLDVAQLTRTVRTPRQVCSDEIVASEAPSRDPKRVTGAVPGAVVGGAAGNQIGDGTGATDGNTTQSVEQRCRTTYDSAPQGYQVRYRLDGREGTVRMDQDPGRRIPVENGELVLDARKP